MKRTFAAEKVVAARLSDTGDAATFVLADEDGAEVTVSLPSGQLAALAAAAQTLAGRVEGAAEAGHGSPPVAMPVERWAVRPEPDEEHITLTFRLTKGMQLNLRLHRTAAAAFTRAMSSLIGRHTPAGAAKAKH